MTRDDIIRMAREAGIIEGFNDVHPSIERFAALVAAHTLSNIDPSRFMSYQEGFEAGAAAEREACAQAYEAEADTWKAWPQAGAAKRKGAAAIRARGETE